ncbi:MAG: glutamate synthase large subunit [Acidimicrobiia bacterium]|nr:glutamate synthase large subunit [Acidimicrobiia bacterium]MDH4306020.1 glutamate synthase large subunit [Acidimicrobiia bacterium]
MSDIRDFPLYDPAYEHDACGVGFIVARDYQPTYRLTRLAVECLQRLDHRGAKAADGTGDGAGLLTQIPYRLLARDLRAQGVTPPAPGRLGVLMTFLPRSHTDRARGVVANALVDEGFEFLGWRRVPIDPGLLSKRALESLPVIEQALVRPCDDLDGEAIERSLLLARKRAERASGEFEHFSIPSSSARTVVYKGLFTAANIADFFWDLGDPDYETAFAIFHQRYSTNTFPSWEIAQPFRSIAHNGEINTIRSNRVWMEARERQGASTLWGDRLADLSPWLPSGQSDSGSLDNVYELLLRSGRGVDHVKEMLIPAAWENVVDLDPELRAFYEYHAFFGEPWDGPAAIAATDGISLIMGLDRNGLRPARYTVTPSVLLVASEAGVCPEEEAQALTTGQLGPGEILMFDAGTRAIRFTDRVKADLAHGAPYGEWISTETLYVQDPFDRTGAEGWDPDKLSRVFGYTAEERRLVLAEMAEGKTPTGSMGNDTPLAALAGEPRRLTQYFQQAFAQVTNPPMDPIREHMVMSLRTYMGRRGSMLEETPQIAHLVELASPILSHTELMRIVDAPRYRAHWIAAVWKAADGPGGVRERLDEICREAAEAVAQGSQIIVLSDWETDGTLAPIPMMLAVGAVHHHLIDAGIRMRASIVAVSGETRDSHDLACLIGVGASAVNPYLAIETVRQLAESDDLHVDPVVAQENYRSALQSGLLKVMSKMGICTVSAYRGSELFEGIGLNPEIIDLAFRNTPVRISGRSLEDIASRVLSLHAGYESGEESVGGFYKQRRGGSFHITSPAVVLAVQKAVRSGEYADWQQYVEKIEERDPSQIRDLLRFVERRPVPLDEVEPADRIMRRFVTAAMSHGAVSKETHEALAEAMNQIGAMSNSGEGGEDAERFDTPRNSAIKQVASGRFGVTPGYLASAEELQIKMAQGSKPGEGGQIPGFKVTEEIARLRHTEPGVSLISPPPHHDIYSIEDLAQLIYDLKAFKSTARVSVKLVSEPGVGTVAVGVAKARADAILISGADGGTGASPLESVKHAGSPWEIGLAEAHQTLVANGLRSVVALETDGGLRTGRDVVIAALLGAERFGWGTLPLIALGCKMVRQCHLNTCPVGIATQREDLRAKFTGAAEQVVALLRLIAEEVRHHLAALGAKTLGEIIGRADLLEAIDHPVAAGLAPLLVRAEGRLRHPGFRKMELSTLSDRLVTELFESIEQGKPASVSYPISNVDRTIGARVSGEIAARYGDTGLEDGTIDIRLSGIAGQSFGAFLSRGVTLRLNGTANDYVGKGMGGGRLVVVPRRGDGSGVPQAGGNACLYGATGGRAFIAGAVGQRFAVRNSGGTAVVEGVSDHACEYMTGGVIVILGPVGRNVAAGMTGGVAYIWDPNVTLGRYLAETSPSMRRPLDAEATEIRALVEEHVQETDSLVAAQLLEMWERQVDRFWVLRAGSHLQVPVLASTARQS